MEVSPRLLLVTFVLSGFVYSTTGNEEESSLVKLLQSVNNSTYNKHLLEKRVDDTKELDDKVSAFETNLHGVENFSAMLRHYKTGSKDPAHMDNQLHEDRSKFVEPSFDLTENVRPLRKRQRQHRHGLLESELLHSSEKEESGYAREVPKNADGIVLGNPRPTVVPGRDLPTIVHVGLKALARPKVHSLNNLEMDLGDNINDSILNLLKEHDQADNREQAISENRPMTATLAVVPNSGLEFKPRSQTESGASSPVDALPSSSSERSDHDSMLQDDIEHADQLISKFLSKEDQDLLDSPQLRHRLEPESPQRLSLQEEERLLQRLGFLKHQLRDRQRLDRLREDRKIRQEGSVLSIAANQGQAYNKAQARLETQRTNQRLISNSMTSALDAGHAEKSLNAAASSFVDMENSNRLANIEESTQSQPKLVISNVTEEMNTGQARAPINRALLAFSYDPESPLGPKMWRILNSEEWTCQGRKQSPINIDLSKVVKTHTIKNVILTIAPPDRALSGILRNNGHAPTLSLSSDVSVRLFGGGLDSVYFLKQLHFHFGCNDSSGSEHRIDGQISPLELHLVFWDNDTFLTFPEAAKGDRGIVVLAVLFQRAFIPAVEAKFTPLAKFVQLLRKIEEEGDDVKVSEVFDLRLEKLIPNVMNPKQADRFFVYEGSLSTPGCYESVTWIVYETQPVVTDGQLEVFRTLKSSKVNQLGTMCNNYRPIQNFNGRRVYSNIV